MLIVLGLTLAALYAVVIGANDMANVVAPLIGSGIAKYKHVAIIFSISVVAGSLLQGYMVMKTLGKGVVKDLDLYGAVSASLAAIVWVSVATRFGLPVSTSQSITSGVIGVGVAHILQTGIIESMNFNVVRNIVISWAASPLLALTLSAILYFALGRAFRSFSNNNNLLKKLGMLIAGYNGYSFGANDVANATGVYLAVAGSLLTVPGIDARILLAAYGAFFIVLGGILFGKRVVNTMAFSVTRLNPIGSIASSLVTASSVWLFTTIPYLLLGFGIPVSTTYIAVGSIMGVGVAAAKSIRRGLNLKIVALIMLSWVLTLPFVSALSMGLYYGLTTLFQGA